MDLRVGDFHEDLSGNKGENKAFIDSKIMDQMGLEDGDSVKIEGSSATVSKAVNAPPSDQGMRVVRMDNYTQENCDSSLGEKVNIRPVDLAEARSVVLAPADKEVMINVEDSRILSNSLNVEYLKEGDKIVSMGKELAENCMKRRKN